MGKLSLEQLRELRKQKQKEMSNRINEDKNIEIVIGMGTCGIAAGAKETFNTFIEELSNQNIENAIVKQTGCMGNCSIEPTVEIAMPGMPTVIYSKVDGQVAKKIIQKHIINKKLLNGHIIDRSSPDIIKEVN